MSGFLFFEDLLGYYYIIMYIPAFNQVQAWFLKNCFCLGVGSVYAYVLVCVSAPEAITITIQWGVIRCDVTLYD